MRTKGSGESPLLLLDVIDVLNALQVPYAIVGAFAASFYGVIRASVDADAVISLSSAPVSLGALVDALHKAGLKATRSRGEPGDPIGTVIHVKDCFDNCVDLLMRIRGMAEAAFTRTIETKFMHMPVRVIGVEDFIAMKLFVGSPKDIKPSQNLGDCEFRIANCELARRKKSAIRNSKSAMRRYWDEFMNDAIGVLNVSSNRVRRPLLKELVQGYGKEALRNLAALLRETR